MFLGNYYKGTKPKIADKIADYFFENFQNASSKDYGRFRKRAKELQKWIVANFDEKTVHEQIIQSIIKAGGYNEEW